MKKFFNTTGPCDPEKHYMVDPLSRCQNLRGLIDQESYFVIHAPRQSRKTTLLESLAQKLTAEGQYAAMRVSCEVGQALRNNIELVEHALLARIHNVAQMRLPEPLWPTQNTPDSATGTRIYAALNAWAQKCPLPLVVFFDEIDALVDLSLEAVLRQLRDGFSYRPKSFPQSIVLCGLRDVRDYKIASGGSQTLGTASPFNIKTESITFKEFDFVEVEGLYLQHTKETGQKFEEGATARAYELTAGQPWLVNALAREVVEKIRVPASETITIAHFDDAAQRLIQTRATHLDSLASKLNEERVRRVIAPILAGSMLTPDAVYNDDILYVRDLGLIAPNAPLRIANPIYREVIVRVLGSITADTIVFNRLSFVDEMGALKVDIILSEFALWWKEHAEAMLRGHVYHEVAAQIVFMAWLHRVVNGGGIIDREYGVGRGRIDILIRWPLPKTKNLLQWQKSAFELKVWAEGKPDPMQQGLLQLESYLDDLSLTEGTLVIFDRRPNAKPSAERTLLTPTQTPKGYRVTLLRA